MRASHRSEILDAAVALIEREGITAVTMDAVAREAGLTKGGLLYHFPSRAALLVAIQWHVAERWEAVLNSEAGKPAEDSTRRERVAAFARANATGGASRADLALLLESLGDPAQTEPWAAMADRWTPRADEVAADPEALDLFILRLAVDGLWAHTAINGQELSAELRARIAGRIAEMAAGEAS